MIGIIKINKLQKEDLNAIFDSHFCCKENDYGVAVNHMDRDSWTLDPESRGSGLQRIEDDCCNNIGDEFDLYLDLDNPKLCFSMKRKHYGDIYKKRKSIIKIEKTAYKIAMTLSRIGTEVELVSYEEVDTIPDRD